ncbi:nicotinamide-nucleotide adenylyltransferase, NadM family / ADP-ribose pyrophosphatase [Xanthomonas phage vB_XciM_LucasX]|nr:nicotinamide-nucleotide adenylyltransferase, NadM family / ADP-ribose pyrophosphatase [Xanthomonas phage vB_XciM_LucasX]
MDTQHDYLVFIGRFEPFHNGHMAVARRALQLGKKLIVLIGSAHKPRSIKNPWIAEERSVMIRTALAEHQDRLIIGQLRDHLYNEDQWIADVQRAVREAVVDFDGRMSFDKQSIRMIGQNKDESSYYLQMFPQWPAIDVSHTAVQSATDLRNYLFDAGRVETHGGMNMIRANVPRPVFEMIDAFRHSSPDFNQLVREHKFIKDYKSGWDTAPYAPTFTTTDAVVTYSGHVLLVRRRAEPGKGLWALPGGFVNPKESIYDSCIRELREETRLRIPASILKGSLKAKEVFDHPDRSLRGRTITHAFHFHFAAGELPPVKGGDDADKARWVPISEVLEMGPRLYEDHLDIIEFFLGQTASQRQSLID